MGGAVTQVMKAEERLVFSPSVEALLIRGVGDQLSDEVRAQVSEMGIDLSRPLLPAYSIDVWNRVVDHIAMALHPERSMAEAQYELGQSTVYGFERTTLGKAMVAVSKLIGPRRALLRFAGSSRSSNNYSYMEAREISPTEIELTAAPFEGHPEYVQGCLCALIDLTGGKNGEVELISHDREQERVVLRARWGA